MMLNIAYVVVFPLVWSMDPLIQDLLTPIADLGERCGYDSCFPVREGWINVHLVPHTHAELGYMKTFDEYFTGHDGIYLKTEINMQRVFDSTISELWADKFRKFTIGDSELPYFFHWWARRDETVRRMVYELVRQGRLVIVGGGWGMNDEASTSYQSIIDSYTYSLRKINATFLSCGRPRVAWQADTFGHSREYASLVAQMGFDGLFINPISFDDELIRMQRKGLEFIWRGSDDLGVQTDIYTHKLFDGYWSPPGFCFGSMCQDPLLISSDGLFNNIDERIDVFVNTIRQRQSPYYNTNHVMVMLGQRLGYFDAKLWFGNIDKLISAFNKRTYKSGEKMHAIYSTPVCFLRAVYEDNPVLETKQDDFLPFAYNKDSYTSGTFTSRPTFKYLVRQSNIFLQISKQLQVLVNLGNNDNFFEAFNWIMGVAQDHNVISGAMRPTVHSYYTQRLHSAVVWSMDLLQTAFNKIRGSPSNTEYRFCHFNISSCSYTEADRFYITVYNPLGWPVTMPVRLPITHTKYEVTDPNGTKINAIMVQIPDHIFEIPNRPVLVTKELVFIAENIPPLGLRSYFIEKQTRLRIKKSLIKKISKNQQKKYFIRQTSKDNRSIFDEGQDYDDFDENKPETKIEFGNIDKLEDLNDYDVVTPKYRLDNETITEYIDTNEFSNWKNNTSGDIQGTVKIESTTQPNKSATKSNESGKNPNESTTNSIESTTKSNESNTNSNESTTKSNESITKSNESTTESSESATKSDESITISNESATKSNESSTEQIESSTEQIESITEALSGTTDTIKQNLSMSMSEVSNATEDINFKTWIEENVTEVPKEINSIQDVNNVNYFAKESKDNFIRNKYIQINLDDFRKVTSMNLSNGVNISLDIQYYFYVSDVPEANLSRRNPGAYIFRSADVNPEPIIDVIGTKVYKSLVVEEIHTKYSKYASFAVKLYVDSPIVEIDWVIGPVPIDDGFGKEVFVRYTTDLVNDGVFYTDSNGRQMIKRIRHIRPLYEPYNLDPVAGNFYPVTSRIYIEDLKRKLRVSIINDRSQGGTSLLEGSIDLILHRRILTDDSGVQTFINETENGVGTIVRGTHYLYLTKSDSKHNRVFEKRFAKEVELRPQIVVNSLKQIIEKNTWIEYDNEFTALKKKLPIGVHLLTLQEWNDKTILLRLENYLEKIDVVKSGVKKILLKDLFVNIKPYAVVETTLSGAILLKDYVPLHWRKNNSFVTNFNEFYGTNKQIEFSDDEFKLVEDVDLNEAITLQPQQIRTFVISYEYVKNKDDN